MKTAHGQAPTSVTGDVVVLVPSKADVDVVDAVGCEAEGDAPQAHHRLAVAKLAVEKHAWPAPAG